MTFDSPFGLSEAQEERPVSHTLLPCYRRLLTYIGWVPFVAALAAPTATYVVYSSLPSDNSFVESDLGGDYVRYVFAAVILFVNQILAPWVSRAYGTLMSLRHESPRLLLMYHAVNIILPIAIMITLDQGCFQNYLHAWTTCTSKSSEFSIVQTLSTARLKARIPEAPANMDFGEFSTAILTTSDVCTPKFRFGFCSRRIVHVLGQLLVLKWLLKMFLQPVSVILFLWIEGPCLRRLGITLEQRMAFDVQNAALAADICEMLLVGPFIPLVYALAFAAFLTRYMTIFVVARSEFVANVFEEHPLDSTEEFIKLPKMHIFFAPLLSIVSLMLFYEENELGGKYVIYTVPLCIFIAGLGATRWCLRRDIMKDGAGERGGAHEPIEMGTLEMGESKRGRRQGRSLSRSPSRKSASGDEGEETKQIEDGTASMRKSTRGRRLSRKLLSQMEDPTVAPADAKDDAAVWAERPISTPGVRRGPSKTRLSI